MSKPLCAALALLAWGLTSEPAFAGNRLLYSRDEGAARCPDEDELRAALHARLGYDAFSPWGERAVVVEISSDLGRLRARVRLLDEHGIVVGTREVPAASDDCEELVRSLALSISIALDPLAPAPRANSDSETAPVAEEPQSAAAPSTPLEPSATPVSPVRDESPRRQEPARNRSRSPTELSLRLGPLLHTGLGPPSTPFGARLGLALERGSTRLVLDATATLPMSVDSEFGGAAHMQLSAASLAPCYILGIVAGCAVLMAGRTSSWASDAPNTRSDSAFYFAVGARLEARAPLSKSFQLVFAGDGLRNLNPVSVQLHEQILWRSPHFAGSLAIFGAVTFQ